MTPPLADGAPAPPAAVAALEGARSDPAWRAVLRWIAGTSIFLGVFGMIGFAIALPDILRDLLGARTQLPWILVLLDDLRLLIAGAASVAVAWGGVFMLSGDPAAARPLRWGSIALISAWAPTLIYAVLLANADTRGALGGTLPDALIRRLGRALGDVMLPAMLCAIVWNSACATMLGLKRPPRSSLGPEDSKPLPENETANPLRQPAMKHTAAILAITAMILATPHLAFIVFAVGIHQARFAWSSVGAFQAAPVWTLLEFANDLGAFLLLAGGIALLRRRRIGRRLIIFGAVGYALGNFLEPLIMTQSQFRWERAVVMFTLQLRVIVTCVLLVALLTRRAVRQTIDADSRALSALAPSSPPPPA
jgi:hypothetical protein